jgi:NADPH:quinone reductase-like Zn-dependent oxidoreductase
MSTARCLWFERPLVLAVRREPLRDPGPGEARVRGLLSAVDAGLTRLLLLGALPEAARPALPPGALRGDLPFPVAYGPVLVGTIDAVGAGVSGARLGQRVLLAHPPQDLLLTDAATLRPAPPMTPTARLCLHHAAECALAAVWDAGVTVGDRLVVCGLGALGLLAVRLARLAGAHVDAVDPDAARASLALDLGASAAHPDVPSAARPIAAADALLDATGSAPALASLIEHAGGDARVVVASFHGPGDAALPLGGRMNAARLDLRMSRGLDPRRRARARAAVAELLSDPTLDELLGEPVPLSAVEGTPALLGSAWPVQGVIDLTG